MTAPIFTTQTFEWLEAIAHQPTAAFYLANKEAFKTYIEHPLRGLMQQEAERLPGMLRSRFETRRNVFSRFLKNDFGHGGAWSNYWGAFYPLGSRRLADVQLAIWINRERLHISFYIGDYGVLPRERFARNCARYAGVLTDLLCGLVENRQIKLARGGRTRIDAGGYLEPEEPMTWAEWLADPAAGDFWAFVPIRPRDVIDLPGDALVRLAVQVHSDFFPLALLAMEEYPLPLIQSYLAA